MRVVRMDNFNKFCELYWYIFFIAGFVSLLNANLHKNFSGFNFRFCLFAVNFLQIFHAEIIYDVKWEKSTSCSFDAKYFFGRLPCNFLSAWTFWFLGSWKLLGRPYICNHRSAGVHWTRWGQVSNWALRGKSNRKCQQENKLPCHGSW